MPKKNATAEQAAWTEDQCIDSGDVILEPKLGDTHFSYNSASPPAARAEPNEANDSRQGTAARAPRANKAKQQTAKGSSGTRRERQRTKGDEQKTKNTQQGQAGAAPQQRT